MLKLSIVIPVYNVEKYLSKCLDSVIYPQLDGYEVIVVNDGSTDSSLTVAEKYLDRYPELIRIISTENGGLGAARNVGIDAANGEFLLFLDSDDRLSDGALPEIMEKLNEDFDICIFGILSVTEDGIVLDDVRSCGREGTLSFPAGCGMRICVPFQSFTFLPTKLLPRTGSGIYISSAPVPLPAQPTWNGIWR